MYVVLEILILFGGVIFIEDQMNTIYLSGLCGTS